MLPGVLPACFPLPMLFSRTRLASRRLVGVALLALVLGQWTMLAHAIAHARTAAVVEHAAGVDQDHSHGWGHDAGTPVCDLVDHLLTGQAPGVSHEAVRCLPPAAALAATAAPSEAPGPFAPAYEARGPPRA
jgi:hypothetical protein